MKLSESLLCHEGEPGKGETGFPHFDASELEDREWPRSMGRRL